MERELVSWLEHLGLSRREAEILSFLLTRGGATVGEISEELGIARPHVYTTLKSLWRRGFVAKTGGRPAYYTAAPSMDVLKHKVEEKAQWDERMLRIIENLTAKSGLPERTLLIEGANAFLTHLLRDIKRARTYVWVVTPRLSTLGSGALQSIIDARSRGCETRVATGDFSFFRRYSMAPSFARYIEPPPPFVLALVDNTAYFAPAMDNVLSGGLVSRDEITVRHYKTYFEHIWVEDYARTLYKVRIRSPREEY